MLSEAPNHPSFTQKYPEVGAAGVQLLEILVNAGYGELFADRDAAAAACTGPLHPAPLGNIAKQRSDGSWKFRLIQDLRRNEVNSAARLPERQVLPRPVDHAIDLATLSSQQEPGQAVWVAVADFADAYMSVPLLERERRFNCAEVSEPLRRTRAPIRPSEPAFGSLVLWRVLGFGGRPNPLIFARISSVLMRLAQAMFPSSHKFDRHRLPAVRAQLYVDDAIFAILGCRVQVTEAFDLILILWLLLGAPISWPKVLLREVSSTAGHTWIGVSFVVREPAIAVMSLPAEFIAGLMDLLAQFAQSFGSVSASDAEVLVGRVARVVYIVPLARAYAAALWSALSAARSRTSEARVGGRAGEAPPGRYPARRFAVAAAWFRALLAPPVDSRPVFFPLEREVLAVDPARTHRVSDWAIVADASPWGG